MGIAKETYTTKNINRTRDTKMVPIIEEIITTMKSTNINYINY